MNRRAGIIVGVLLGVIAAAGWWGWSHTRTVDGRNAAAWLALARTAAQTVAYRAEGQTTAQGKQAAFTLNQGAGGRYTMQVEGPGCACSMGHDGQYAWYRAGGQEKRVASAPTSTLPDAANARILGTGSVAGQPVVRLRVRSGQVMKDVSLDRRTGVVLAMETREGWRTVSRMHVTRIAYQEVTVAASPAEAQIAIRPATRAELTKLLGAPPVIPAWLPRGLTARGSYRTWCDCCKTELAALRYGDGVRSLTLFQAGGAHHCAMAGGCRMAPTGCDLVQSRRVNNLTVIAVGNLDQSALAKVLSSLR